MTVTHEQELEAFSLRLSKTEDFTFRLRQYLRAVRANLAQPQPDVEAALVCIDVALKDHVESAKPAEVGLGGGGIEHI